MSRTVMRTKQTRDSHVEQSPYNRKRKSSTDDSGIAYQSAPEYLRRLMNTSSSSNGHSARRLTRTHSASEMTPQNKGNPKYKAPEDYYDEIQLLKKELKYTKDDNSNLRAKIRRLEEDNARKCKEIDNLYDPNKNGDLRRTLANTSTPTTNVIMNLKQRIFKLELQLKQRETILDEIKNDPRWTKSTELEIQNRALFNELEKQKLESLHVKQNDYMASLDEEMKNAIRKLETEKQAFKVENENLKKKVNELKTTEHDGQLSARRRDGSTDKNLLRKIDDLKEICQHYENELDEMKSDLRQMRRERDKYRDKFDAVNEELEEIRHGHDQYNTKFNRQSSRSSITTARRKSSSSEELSKKDSRPNSSIRKSNEHISLRSSLLRSDRNRSSLLTSKKSTSFRNLRRDGWTNDDENRVKNFRENHAATVIQRGWLKHKKPQKHSFINPSRQDTFDKRHSKLGGMKSSETRSPRDSQQKLGSKMDNLGSGAIKNRSSSPNMSSESALKIVQASLRGYINRTKMNTTSPKKSLSRKESDDDDDIIETSSRQFGSPYGNERKRENLINSSKKSFGDINDKFGSNNRLFANPRNSTSNFHRSLSPPLDSDRALAPGIGHGDRSKETLPYDRNKFGSGNRESSPTKQHRTPSPPANIPHSSSPRFGSISDSKQMLPNDRNKLGSGNRLSINDRESPSKEHRLPSPPADIHHFSSPRSGSIAGSKQSLLNDKNKFNSDNRIDRQSPLKFQRSSSPPPSTDRRFSQHKSSENIRPTSRQSNISLRKSPTNSKQSLKNTQHDDDDDDDDVLGY